MKIVRNAALAGLLAAGIFSGSAFAQPAAVPPLADLIAAVQQACVPDTPFDQQSPACQQALLTLLATYPNSAEAIAVAVSFVGAEQVELLLLETAAVAPPVAAPVLGGDGTAPDTPS